MRVFIATIDAISTLFGIIAALLMGASILIVCQMVLFRYGLNTSTTWQTDIVTYALVGATLIGSPYVLKQGGHVTIDFLYEAVSPGAKRLIKVVSNLGTLIVALVLTYAGGHFFWQAWDGNWLSESVAEIPLWIPYLSLPIGFGLLALQALAEIAAVLFPDAACGTRAEMCNPQTAPAPMTAHGQPAGSASGSLTPDKS